MAPKKGVKAPLSSKKKNVTVANPMFGIQGAFPLKDLHRFVKWPNVVHIQRHEAFCNSD
ncbi:hypothetical protein ACHQM5_016808 [Ranunculus cassubicifolius]